MPLNRLLYIGHAVANRAAAEETYQRVLGAQCFHRGAVPGLGPDVSLLLVERLCIALVPIAGFRGTAASYAERFGGGFDSIRVEASDVSGLTQRVEAAGVRCADVERVVQVTGGSPAGLRIDLHSQGLPNDPRDRPGSAPSGSPAHLRDLYLVSLLVEETEAARAFLCQTLQLPELAMRPPGL